MKKSVSISPEYGSRAHRRAEAFACHAIEGIEATAEDIAMFEMFDREGWSDEQRRVYIIAQATETTLAAE
jgi:hypothetical protein